MSLYPGGRDSGQYSLDDNSMKKSMAQLIEDEFAALYQAVKGSPLPASARQDMRIIFVAVSRGVLRYLSENQAGNIVTQLPAPQVKLTVDLEKA